MLVNTEGIVLSNIKYAETSRIVKIYTAQKGLQTYMVKGVKSKKSKVFPAMLNNLSIVDIVAYDSPKKNIQLLKEARLAYNYNSIPFDIRKSSIVIFINEVLYNCIKEEEENPELYSFLRESIIYLDTTEGSFSNFHLVFLMQLTKYLGFFPLANCTDEQNHFSMHEGCFTDQPADGISILNEKKSNVLFQFMCSGYEALLTPKNNNQERADLLADIIMYYNIHVHNFKEIKSLSVLKTVLS